LREQVAETRRQGGSTPVFYTEWNTSANARDPLHDEPYAAAFIVKTVLEASPLVQGYGFWTFSDIFEEEGFASRPFHGGFGLLTIHGIGKPAYRAFELLHALGGEMLGVTGTDDTVDVWVVRDARVVAVVLVNHALPRHPIGTRRVRVTLTDAPKPDAVTIERIDAQHANPKRLWQEMGEPEYPDPDELEQLHQASCLHQEQQPWRYEDRSIALDVVLPPHAVASVTLQFRSAAP
jgi:xylan 1,4-beta-xylosidase